MSSEPGTAVAVSVVIPVYNPGALIERCIGSILAQTLPRERYEAIFVDDGSTDDTPARLDQLAADEPNIRVFHEPNSGWPGRPRNVGIDNAVGRYVYFCDHDDWLGPEALERMVAFADDAAADILIGKTVGHNRPNPQELFVANMTDATLWASPLMTSLKPHKLFRRSFLDQHKLRYPEGKRRLEDHVFVLEAYFLASKIAVLSDYTCYHHTRRDDHGNAATARVEPKVYFAYLREVIDVIDKYTSPGPQRDQLLERPLRQEMLSRLTQRSPFGSAPTVQGQEQFDVIRTLLLERFPPGFGDQLGLALRVRAALVRHGQIELLRDFNARADQVRARAALISMRWADDRWHAEIETELVLGDDSPVRFISVGADRWSVDSLLLPAELQEDVVVSTAELINARVWVRVVNRRSDEDWFVPTTYRAELRDVPGDERGAKRLVVALGADLDPATLAGGGPLPRALWNISVRFAGLGMELRTRLRSDQASPASMPSAAIVGRERITVVPFLTPERGVSLDVGQRKHTLLGAMCERPIGPPVVARQRLTARVDVEIAPSAGRRAVQLFLLAGDIVVDRCPGAIIATTDGVVLRLRTAPRASVAERSTRFGPARYTLAGDTRGARGRVLLGVVDVDARGRIVAADFDPARRQEVVPLPPGYGRRSALNRVRRRASRFVRR